MEKQKDRKMIEKLFEKQKNSFKQRDKKSDQKKEDDSVSARFKSEKLY